MSNCHIWAVAKALFCTALLLAAAGPAALAQPAAAPKPAQAGAEWPQFLGPTRNGISAETGLIEQWPAGGFKPVWREGGGVGMSGLAISGGKLITLVQKKEKQWVVSKD